MNAVRAGDGSFSAQGLQSTTVAPSSGRGHIAFSTSAGPHFQLGLPTVASNARAEKGDGGSIVYVDLDGLADVVVQPMDNGARIQTVINGPNSPTDFRYELDPGTSAILNSDGSVDILRNAGGVTVSIGHLDVPWALDANGKSVPTRFFVSDRSITQVVDHRSGATAYPVVADPSVSLGWYVYIKYSKSEVQRYWSGTTFLNKAAAAAACGAVAGIYGAAACGSLTSDYFSSIGQTFADAKKYNQCVQLGLTYVGFVPVTWKRLSC